MTYSLLITNSYQKQAKKFFIANPNLKDKYFKVITILVSNPFHKSLRTHVLNGKLKNFYSVSITFSIRLVFVLNTVDKQIIPISVGNHDQVY